MVEFFYRFEFGCFTFVMPADKHLSARDYSNDQTFRHENTQISRLRQVRAVHGEGVRDSSALSSLRHPPLSDLVQTRVKADYFARCRFLYAP